MKRVPAAGGVSQRIIDDTHAMVQQHRASIGLEPWDFSQPRTKEHGAYTSYRQWCLGMGIEPATFERWQGETRKISGTQFSWMPDAKR